MQKNQNKKKQKLDKTFHQSPNQEDNQASTTLVTKRASPCFSLSSTSRNLLVFIFARFRKISRHKAMGKKHMQPS